MGMRCKVLGRRHVIRPEKGRGRWNGGREHGSVRVSSDAGDGGDDGSGEARS